MRWTDFDALARGLIRPALVHELRRAERSRRLLLLRALLDEATKTPNVFGPMPAPDEAWDLLARVDTRAPGAFDLVFGHPYVGSWVGYTIRLLRKGISGVCPLWAHIGHVHSIAAAAAMRAGIDFRISVPAWRGGVILPTIGLARLPAVEVHSVAEIRGIHGQVEIINESGRVVVTSPFEAPAPHWSPIRQVTAIAGPHRLAVRLDDVDPYRGLHEPELARRLDETEVAEWRELLTDAWHLIAQHLPWLADAISVAMTSIVPSPAVRFRNVSASTGEAFGSAIIGRPNDSAALAATLVHEFQHVVLGGVLHLTNLYDDDPGEQFYVPWRPDPRPLSGVLQGIYAFFGITTFWREVARAEPRRLTRRATFEFARARSETWRALDEIRHDTGLTVAGRRFVEGIAERLRQWLDEPVDDDLGKAADVITTDHYAGWRLRHLRPHPQTVLALTEAWLAGRPRPPLIRLVDTVPTPVPDGEPSEARAILISHGVTLSGHHELKQVWRSIPHATLADLAYATGRFADASRGYRAQLAKDPDRASALVGLGLALTGLDGGPAARALTQHPELVRAVRRQISMRTGEPPTPELLAGWLGRMVN